MSTERSNADAAADVWDVGFFNGDFSGELLDAGLRVVGYEPNPDSLRRARAKFEPQIKGNGLVLRGGSLSDSARSADLFTISGKPEWSTLRPGAVGTATGFEATVRVKCFDVKDEVRLFGIPRLIKIDAEGEEVRIIGALAEIGALPKYLTVELSRGLAGDIFAILGRHFSSFSLLQQSSLGAVAGGENTLHPHHWAKYLLQHGSLPDSVPELTLVAAEATYAGFQRAKELRISGWSCGWLDLLSF
jgi:FkbM family methyltransferase